MEGLLNYHATYEKELLQQLKSMNGNLAGKFL